MKLNRYADELTTYRKQGGLPQGEVKNALVDIYEELWPKHKNWGSSKINRNCPSCLSDMMKSLCAYWESTLKYEKFEGIPVEAVMLEEIEIEETGQEFFKDVLEDLEDNLHKYASQLPWGELRKYATSLGINTKGKKKAEILEELKEL